MPDVTQGLKYKNSQERVLHLLQLRLHERMQRRRNLSTAKEEAYNEVLAWIKEFERDAYMTNQIKYDMALV